jgi:hypothetical protein
VLQPAEGDNTERSCGHDVTHQYLTVRVQNLQVAWALRTHRPELRTPPPDCLRWDIDLCVLRPSAKLLRWVGIDRVLG